MRTTASFRSAAVKRLLAVVAMLACCAIPAGAMAQVTASFLQPMGPVAQEQASHLLRVVGADTVMQSLLIAPLTGQVYAMPGMTTGAPPTIARRTVTAVPPS